MTFEVIEQFVESKNNERVCEDMIVVTDNFAAVIDGASDATGADFGGMSGGRFAAEVGARAVTNLPADATARTFADRLTSALADAVTDSFGQLGPDTRWPVAVVACISASRREIWRIGDLNAVVAGVAHLGELQISTVTSPFRAAVNTALLNKGTPLSEIIQHDPGVQAARALINLQQHLANRVGPWGYGCINGQTVPDEYIETFPLAAQSTEVILTTDGYPVPRGTLAETETRLQEMMRRDPAAIGELASVAKVTKPGANAPDDRAYLRLMLH